MKLNKEYKQLSEEILNEEHFKLLKSEVHHGTNRYDHCKRVSHLSYFLTKIFKGNRAYAVRAGLFHDFFYGNAKYDESVSYLNHPFVSINNSKKYFELTSEEQDIIKSHMYHYMLVKNIFKIKKENIKEYKPKSKEGKIVCISDLLVSIYECLIFKARYTTCLYFVFLFNLIRY